MSTVALVIRSTTAWSADGLSTTTLRTRSDWNAPRPYSWL